MNQILSRKNYRKSCTFTFNHVDAFKKYIIGQDSWVIGLVNWAIYSNWASLKRNIIKYNNF